MEWTNEQLPKKFPEKALRYDEGRIIIPMLDRDGMMFGYQGRSLKPDADIRYITIMLDDSHTRFFGLDRVDFNRRWYIFEGPVDSLHIPNSLACCGGDLSRELQTLSGNIDNSVTVYDNEPRGKDIIRGMQRAITDGRKVCIWPDWLEVKDVNKMVVDLGYAEDYIKDIIDKFTYQGLRAQLALNKWSKL